MCSDRSKRLVTTFYRVCQTLCPYGAIISTFHGVGNTFLPKEKEKRKETRDFISRQVAAGIEKSLKFLKEGARFI